MARSGHRAFLLTLPPPAHTPSSLAVGELLRVARAHLASPLLGTDISSLARGGARNSFIRPYLAAGPEASSVLAGHTGAQERTGYAIPPPAPLPLRWEMSGVKSLEGKTSVGRKKSG